jgi:transcriptional regulator with XRE-family HTH domain
MPKTKRENTMSFSERLATLRKAAGFTQQELADEVGVSQRVIAYYEAESEHPPTTLLPAIAKALGVSTDALLGHERAPKTPKAANTRLQRRLQQIEKLDAREKRQVLQLLDAFIERARFKEKAGAAG